MHEKGYKAIQQETGRKCIRIRYMSITSMAYWRVPWNHSFENRFFQNFLCVCWDKSNNITNLCFFKRREHDHSACSGASLHLNWLIDKRCRL